jgi:threonine dehydratase
MEGASGGFLPVATIPQGVALGWLVAAPLGRKKQNGATRKLALEWQRSMKTMREQVSGTYELVKPFVRRTPVIEVESTDFGIAGPRIRLKLEFLQHTGSFKPRGAFANLLSRKPGSAGVVAASGGNHGLAVAYVASRLGVAASIFVPSVATATNQEQIRSLGGRLTIAGERYADALNARQRFAAESGALEVHAFDQLETLLGQGSIGVELQEQCADLDTLLVAVGGGGLIGGIAAWYDGAVKLVGVEPRAAPTLYRALEAGHPVDAEAGGIAADSLADRRAGELMFPLAQKFVDRVVLVEDDAITQAQRSLWRVLRIIAEPGGAAAMAALQSGEYRPQPGERVGVVLCGANTDPATVVTDHTYGTIVM